ncbi:Imm52 family immunity protein [Methylocapsa sp. S129]|uniref:Imm52 family immunity protein n=1 Tax=Methylocapsa sp. S129 TaxID=1641869 RepID=UPI00131C78BF|nr:Imm52 family immunity protein [Methylocapsa sp. S129]
MDKLHLDLWWEAREPAQADDARRLSDFVTGLPDFDPIYQSWLGSPTTREETVRVPLSEAEAKQLLVDTMNRYDFGGGLWPEQGSDVWGGHAGSPPYDFRESSYADTNCHIGSYGPHKDSKANHIFMRLSALRPTTGRLWRASELRPLMKFACEIWKPAEMCAMFPFYIRDLPSIPNPLWTAHQRSLKPWIGWITYLPPDLASRAKYPADVEVETLEDGSVLVTLCEELFEKNDAEGLARLHALEAALRPIQS